MGSKNPIGFDISIKNAIGEYDGGSYLAMQIFSKIHEWDIDVFRNVFLLFGIDFGILSIFKESPLNNNFNNILDCGEDQYISELQRKMEKQSIWLKNMESLNNDIKKIEKIDENLLKDDDKRTLKLLYLEKEKAESHEYKPKVIFKLSQIEIFQFLFNYLLYQHTNN